MLRLVRVLLRSFASALRSRRELALENLALRHQLSVLHATPHRRLSLTDLDRAFWIALQHRWADWKRVLVVIQPETVVRRHREGLRRYWRRRSRRHPGRPEVDAEIRSLICRWPVRIHSGVLRGSMASSSSWEVAIDFFTVPSATFRVLFVFIVLAHDRRRVLHFNITEHPTAEWTALQIVQAFPWDGAPRYLLRDRDCIYGNRFRRRVAGLKITEVLISPRSPWQNPFVDRHVVRIAIREPERDSPPAVHGR